MQVTICLWLRKNYFMEVPIRDSLLSTYQLVRYNTTKGRMLGVTHILSIYFDLVKYKAEEWVFININIIFLN